MQPVLEFVYQRHKVSTFINEACNYPIQTPPAKAQNHFIPTDAQHGDEVCSEWRTALKNLKDNGLFMTWWEKVLVKNSIQCSIILHQYPTFR